MVFHCRKQCDGRLWSRCLSAVSTFLPFPCVFFSLARTFRSISIALCRCACSLLLDFLFLSFVDFHPLPAYPSLPPCAFSLPIPIINMHFATLFTFLGHFPRTAATYAIGDPSIASLPCPLLRSTCPDCSSRNASYGRERR